MLYGIQRRFYKRPIPPVVLNKFRDLWDYENEHKKVRTPNRKTNYCELNVEDSKLMFVEDNKNRLCILSFCIGYSKSSMTEFENPKRNEIDFN